MKDFIKESEFDYTTLKLGVAKPITKEMLNNMRKQTTKLIEIWKTLTITDKKFCGRK
jgi:hypothetical protein